MGASLSYLPARAYRAVVGPWMALCEGGDTNEPKQKKLRIIIIGKTGNGKSSLGNAILGRKIFDAGSSMSSTTQQVQVAKADLNGCIVTVVDTPDPVNSDQTPEQLQAEIRKWKQLAAPAASAILLAVRCDVRYTAEEYDIYKKIKAHWPSSDFCQRLIVVFTFADRQDRDIKEELKTVCRELKNVLKDASGRYILFNNMASEEEVKDTVRQLLKIIDSMGEVTLLSTLMLMIFSAGIKWKIFLWLALVGCILVLYNQKGRGGKTQRVILPSPKTGKIRAYAFDESRLFYHGKAESLRHYTSRAFEQVCNSLKANFCKFLDAVLNQPMIALYYN